MTAHADEPQGVRTIHMMHAHAGKRVKQMINRSRQHMHPARRSAFTIIEMLTVLGIILLLLGILVVALNRATQTAQSANTRSLMNSIKQSLTVFRDDHGYLPPILDNERNLVTPPPPDDTDSTAVQNWFSNTTIAEYLIGYGGSAEDGYGEPQETPSAGIRSPGGDGVWNALFYGAGELDQRNPQTKGQVFGPYLQLKDERLLGSIDGSTNPATGQLNVFFPGEAGYDREDPHVVADYWGSPLRFYRLPYPAGALGQRVRPVGIDSDLDGAIDTTPAPPALGNVIALRPYSIDPNEATERPAAFADASGRSDVYSVRWLDAAEYAIFSAGPDRASTDDERVDTETEYNQDNLVEVGP